MTRPADRFRSGEPGARAAPRIHGTGNPTCQGEAADAAILGLRCDERGGRAMVEFAGGAGSGTDWRAALNAALDEAQRVERPDLAFLFAHSAFAPHYAELITAAHERLQPRVLIGCSGQGVIATGREIEDVPAVSVMTVTQPQAVLRPLRLEGPRPRLPSAP